MLKKSTELAAWIESSLSGITFPRDDRKLFAAACFTVVQDHHSTIVHLIGIGTPSPAFCLARSVYEGYIRGAWLAHCATEQQAQEFIEGKEPPKLSDLIGALETLPNFDSKTLSRVKSQAWQTMCDYAHVGGRLAMRWINHEGIGENFHPEDINEVLSLTGALSLISAAEMAAFSGNEQLAIQILDKAKAFSWNE